MFYQNSKIPAVYQAIAVLLACNMAQNIDIPGCLSGYSRTFSLHFVLNVIFLLWIENLGDFLGAA